MKHWKSLGGTTAVFLATGGMAQAEVTSAEVWEAWQAMAQSVGQTMTPGSESMDGGTLTLSELEISMATTDVSVTGTIPEVVFTEQGDGTVAVDISPSYDMVVTIAPESGETVTVTLTIDSDGLMMLASGDPGAVNYDYEAASMDISVSELDVDGEVLELDAVITLSGLSGVYGTSGGDDAMMTTAMNADSLDIAIQMDEPDGGDGAFDANLSYADISSRSDGSMMLFAGGVKKLPEMLAAGLGTEAAITHGAATYEVNFEDGSDAFALSGTADSGLLEVALSAQSLSYDIGNTGLDISMSGSEIPLPEVAFSLGELGLGLLMPVSASEEPQDFGLGITLADLAVSDMIWSMIDAGGQLPHDPATLIVDVSGKANFLFDIFNPDSAMEVDAEMPAELHALDVNQVRVAIAGAELTSTGGFTFDMSNLETFDGMPAPTGKLDIRVVGANGLMDTLVAMGLLPEDQAMGARMMMGLFARPGDGPDTLVSEIEVDGATGAISANGQRLQ